MRDPTVETRRYWLLRWWRPRDNKICYAKDLGYRADYRRTWSTCDAAVGAYQFQHRSDARQAARAKAFEDLRDGDRNLVRDPTTGRGVYMRDPASVFFWEIVEVTETITTTFEEEVSGSNAPPMVQLARAAQ